MVAVLVVAVLVVAVLVVAVVDVVVTVVMSSHSMAPMVSVTKSPSKRAPKSAIVNARSQVL